MNIKQIQLEILEAERVIERNKMILQLFIENEELKKPQPMPAEGV